MVLSRWHCKHLLDAQAGEALVRRMFARAWEDGRITKDEQLLLNEVVDFLGMHPERVRRLSNEARREINVPPPEEIYLDMLRQALVDGAIHDEEEALLKTVQVAFDIDIATHERLLNEAKKLDKQGMLNDQIKMMKEQMKKI